MRPLATALIVLLLLAMPAAAVAPSIVTASHAAASGDVTVEAPFAGMLAQTMPSGLDVTRLRIEAATATGNVERQPQDTVVLGASFSIEEPEPPREISWGRVNITFGQPDPSAYVAVVPAPQGATLSVESHQVAMQGPQTAILEERGYTGNVRPRLATDLADATSLGGASWTGTVEGDLVLAVWGYSVRVEHADGAVETIDTGAEMESSETPGGLLRVYEQRSDTFLYLRLKDARLDLDALQIPDQVVYTTGGVVTTDGSIVFEDAEGTLAGVKLAPGGVPVHAAGAFSAVLRPPSEGRVTLEVDGKPDRMIVDGATVATQDTMSGWWLLLALPVLGGSLWTWNRFRPGTALARLQRSLAAGHDQRVIRQAPRLFDRPHVGDRARLAAAVAMLRRRRPDEAMDVLGPATSVAQAMRQFLEAHACALRGDTKRAHALLHEATATMPHLVREARRNPELARLLTAVEGGGYA